MGIVAALGSALAWAVASTLFASQVSRSDTLSASALRTIGAVSFFAVAIFALGAASDVGQMSASDLLQLMGTGFLLLVVGESLYTASIATIGLTRAFPTVMGLEYVFAFLLAAVLLDETVTWQIAVGSLLVIGGVYLVAFYGRAPRADGTAASDPPVGRASEPSSVQAPGPLMGSRWSLLRSRGGSRGGNRRAARLGESAGSGAGEHTAGGQETRLPIIGRITPGFWVGFALAVITGMAWGGGIVWLSSAADGFDSAAAGSVRLWGGAPFLLLATMAQPESQFRRRTLPRRASIILIASGALGYGAASLLFIVALGEVGAGPAVVLFSTSPIIGLLLGALFLRDRITIWVAVGTILAVAGVMLIA